MITLYHFYLLFFSFHPFLPAFKAFLILKYTSRTNISWYPVTYFGIFVDLSMQGSHSIFLILCFLFYARLRVDFPKKSNRDVTFSMALRIKRAPVPLRTRSSSLQ